ncbi:MAG: leucyl aminopeptidase family protein [Bdellovibrionales bacterium]|nr:leucyl aminopeptidase family protein [Bdellovibrionales bacterium]
MGSAVVVIPVTAAVLKAPGSSKMPVAVGIDTVLGGSLFDELQAVGFSADGKENHEIVRIAADRGGKRMVFLIVPFARETDVFRTLMAYRRLGEAAYACAKKHKMQRIVIVGNDIELGNRINLAAMVEAVALGSYDFVECLSKKPVPHEIEDLLVFGCDDMRDDAAQEAMVTAEGIKLMRTLSLLPPNRKHPMAYAARVEEALAPYSDCLRVEVIDADALAAMRAGGILGVNSGSGFPACLLKITYVPEGGSDAKPVAFIGKGVIMDTGGYSLKPPAMQPDMKGDCGGGNTVVGAMRAIGELRPPYPITAYVPLVENRVSSTARVPSDVLESLSGQTVEDLNTDAEGRLILMDAITLAQRDGSTTLIDLATLTGACVVALGNTCSGAWSNSDELCGQVLAAAESSGDRMWRMPLLPELDGDLKSGVADLANIGTDRMGGAIHAALFLQRFVVDGTEWIHLDIAGPGCNKIKDRSAFRGGPVGTLVNFALNLSA